MNFTFLRIRLLGYGLGSLAIAACAPSSLIDVAPPNAVADPAVVATANGATQMYNFALTRWGSVVAGNTGNNTNYVASTGVYTDELMFTQGGAGSELGLDLMGLNSLIGGRNELGLHSMRLEASQAREALRAYGPQTPVAWQARLQAAEAYAIIHLAELYCSGVPLSMVPLITGSPTYTRGFTTEELFGRAAVLFDSAVTLAGDSTRFRYLAEVGKGRALLGLGRFSDAAAAVADVPTDFVYLLEVGTTTTNINLIGNKPQSYQVRDNEGTNGLVWSLDPRTAIQTTPSISGAMPVPAKYSVTASGALNPLVAAPNARVRGADGIEARLIEAEASLALGNANWLTTLNTLRSTCIGTAACAPVPGLTPASLPPLPDPGNANARLDLVMKERAMWLYLTGHRQGELRRMAHVYHRDPATLWPVGIYLNPGFPPLIQPVSGSGTSAYGVVYVASPDINNNPLYSGCNDLNP